jgi:hypothetical protein
MLEASIRVLDHTAPSKPAKRTVLASLRRLEDAVAILGDGQDVLVGIPAGLHVADRP